MSVLRKNRKTTLDVTVGKRPSNANKDPMHLRDLTQYLQELEANNARGSS
jgi:hypothetical protein